jgi:alpha-glucosidase
MSWWREGVVYQIYPRSFADANGDGVGDLNGIRARLDYLEWLGVDAVWLNPTTPSPNADWGYDVADYYGVDADLGTQDDLDALVREAGERGIRVVLDLVPNHTSDRHPWFQSARSSRDAPQRDWYVWANAPNNWRSAFGGPAWTLDEPTGQHYLHNFLPQQPDLNWWNEDVRAEFDRILRHWLDRGIAGFRIDVAHAIVKDRELRDDPPVDDSEHPVERREGLRRVYSMNRPETHDVLRRWRRIADEYDERCLLGETYVLDPERLVTYYGSGRDELHLAFNFRFLHARLDARALASEVATAEALLPADAWPVWTASNHDAGRLATRWCRGDADRARCALVVLLTLRGTPVLYYGDELALPNTRVPRRARLDMAGRDPGRTPMHWTDEPGAGFTSADAQPWLPFGDVAACNAADQRADPSSPLHLCRDLIGLRRDVADLRAGAYAPLESPRRVWAWRRGESIAVAVNLSGRPAALDFPPGVVRVGTDRRRDGERIGGRLALDAWEGVVTSPE